MARLGIFVHGRCTNPVCDGEIEMMGPATRQQEAREQVASWRLKCKICGSDLRLWTD